MASRPYMQMKITFVFWAVLQRSFISSHWWSLQSRFISLPFYLHFSNKFLKKVRSLRISRQLCPQTGRALWVSGAAVRHRVPRRQGGLSGCPEQLCGIVRCQGPHDWFDVLLPCLEITLLLNLSFSSEIRRYHATATVGLRMCRMEPSDHPRAPA